jgi:hypothetical protein
MKVATIMELERLRNNTKHTQRKGFSPTEEDVPVILAIHNLVNEQGAFVTHAYKPQSSTVFGGSGWSKILEWERMKGLWVL